MPDWTYHTLFRPALFHMPAARARSTTLRGLHALGSFAFGPQLIALMGHTRPAVSLRTKAFGLSFDSPVIISADLPGNEQALAALSRFGVGAVELGPVAMQSWQPVQGLVRQLQQQNIILSQTSAESASDMVAILQKTGSVPARIGMRLAHKPQSSAEEASQERLELIRQLDPYVDYFTLTPPDRRWSAENWRQHLATIQAAVSQQRPLLVCLYADHLLPLWLEQAIAQGIEGIVLCGALSQNGTLQLGQAARQSVRSALMSIRQSYPEQLTIMAGGTVLEPTDALDLKELGADFVQLDAGLVFSGPGLPKRINEALRFHLEPPSQASGLQSLRQLRQANWLWLFLLGLGMGISGMFAWLVAADRVILPYDEHFVGLSTQQLMALNPRILPFMAHDRVSLAGTMISIGIVYMQLAYHAIRYRVHWATQALKLSATVGFLSIFLFLGYGYFDPLHALLATILLPLFLLGLRGVAPAPPIIPQADLHNDRAWRLAQWGQLGIIGLGAGLIIAGIAIVIVGITTVFVPEDLAFLCTTAQELNALNQRLIALIAHDRAGFGGALVSQGLAVLLLGLWGIRRGASWLWWTLLWSGALGFLAALGVHLAVGYLDFIHLLPGLIAVLVYALSMGLLFPFLCNKSENIS